MGLFTTLTGSGDAQVSSGEVPTVLQMYADKPIQLDATANITGYSAMTYQAVQVGSSHEEELRNRHQNPDLGVWNCRIPKGDDKQAFVDALMAKLGKDIGTFCWTVHLGEETNVEPTISLLQSALVRHLIDNTPSSTTANVDENGIPQERKVATTSLYQLQATQFGKANEDKDSSAQQNIRKSHQDIKTCLMICAILPDEPDEVSESAFMKKQAKALIIYHLRKFAAALDAVLCFVESSDVENTSDMATPASNPPSPSKESQHHGTPSKASGKAESSHSQPTVTYDTLAQYWRDLAKGQAIWMQQEDGGVGGEYAEEGAEPVATAPLYGPGRHQDDLIETVLLRNAHYPGHWDASTDSLWVALPTPSNPGQDDAGQPTGDQGWLTQLRESIVVDAPPPTPATPQAAEEKPKEKDAAVSSFFESLLKNP